MAQSWPWVSQIAVKKKKKYENSSLQFFRTTTGMLSGPETSNESILVMIALSKVEIRLVLEGKVGKVVPWSFRLKFLEKVLVNNFTLLGAEDNTSQPLNRKCI